VEATVDKQQAEDGLEIGGHRTLAKSTTIHQGGQRICSVTEGPGSLAGVGSNCWTRADSVECVVRGRMCASHGMRAWDSGSCLCVVRIRRLLVIFSGQMFDERHWMLRQVYCAVGVVEVRRVGGKGPGSDRRQVQSAWQ